MKRGRGVAFAGSVPETGDMSSPLLDPSSGAAMDDILSLLTALEACLPGVHASDRRTAAMDACTHGGFMETESWQLLLLSSASALCMHETVLMLGVDPEGPAQSKILTYYYSTIPPREELLVFFFSFLVEQ